jgi:molybdopterin converting factor small subunit
VILYFYGPLAKIVNSQAVEYKNTPSTILELLDDLAKRYGRSFRDELFDKAGEFRRQKHIILVNGKNMYYEQGLETILTPESELRFFVAAAGG